MKNGRRGREGGREREREKERECERESLCMHAFIVSLVHAKS